ncbi:MAG: hydroxymethylglutaryl-CoA lyase [Saprospiraceae bacterium]|nr:hydroxymethylglutaryl-CoA lyase [Saprospiraceae bacterium]
MIILEEQGLRDGFQNLEKIVPTDMKLRLIDQLIDAGLQRIQVASFVHPKWVPQMADADTLCLQLKKREGIVYSGLVLNLKGVERGLAAGLDHLACSISASNTHSQKNARKTLAEAKSAFKEMVKVSQAGSAKVRGGIQCAFGCRYEGKIAEAHVLDMVKHHLDQGIDELALADSTGMANPRQMRDLMGKVVELAKGKPVILHLHNTENKGLANVFAALEAGVKYFDTAFGGLGGCPFIKSATGNIATEDTAHMLHQMGYETGIDIGKLAVISEELQTYLGHELQGQLYKLWNKPEIKIV